MKLLVTGGAGFIGSHYVRSVLTGAWGGTEPDSVVVLDKLTYAGNLENLAPVADDERLRIVEGDILDRPTVDGLMAEADAVVHFAAESHVDRSILGAADFVMTNVVGTQTLLDSALAARDREVRARLHRRGLRVDRGGQLGRRAAAGAELAVLRLQGLQRPARPRLPPHPRAAGVRHALLQQLRALPVPGEGHPAVRHEPDGRRARSRCTARVRTSATGCTSTTTAARSTWCSSSGRAGEVYNIGGGTELSNMELTGLLLQATGTDWDRVKQRRRPPGSRPALLRRLHQEPHRAGLRAAGRLRAGPRRHRRVVPRPTASWWEPLKERAQLSE